jgi:hypothetical protein
VVHFKEIFQARMREFDDKEVTPASVFAALTAHYATRTDKPFANNDVDEAQDFGVAELRFLAAIAPEARDALFFAGDLGQRIFQQPFSWGALGVDIRGRSFPLRVNYRTSHQIRLCIADFGEQNGNLRFPNHGACGTDN